MSLYINAAGRSITAEPRRSKAETRSGSTASDHFRSSALCVQGGFTFPSINLAQRSCAESDRAHQEMFHVRLDGLSGFSFHIPGHFHVHVVVERRHRLSRDRLLVVGPDDGVVTT